MTIMKEAWKLLKHDGIPGGWVGRSPPLENLPALAPGLQD